MKAKIGEIDSQLRAARYYTTALLIWFFSGIPYLWITSDAVKGWLGAHLIGIGGIAIYQSSRLSRVLRDYRFVCSYIETQERLREIRNRVTRESDEAR